MNYIDFDGEYPDSNVKDDNEPIPLGILGLFVAVVGAFLLSQKTTTVPKSITFEKTTTKQKTKQYNYWKAELINNEVEVTDSLSLYEACLRVSQGNSIMCRNKSAAFVVVLLNGYKNYVGPEIHGDVGYYYHYHPTRNHNGYKSIHIWYYVQ